MVVKDNQREAFKKETRREARKKYIGINNHCELSLERFLNNSTEIIEELLEFAREKGITVERQMEVTLGDFQESYRKTVNLLEIESKVLGESDKWKTVDERLCWIKELNENEKWKIDIDRRKLIRKEVIEAISKLLFKGLEDARFNENALNVFSEEGMKKYSGVESDEYEGNVIWTDWKRLVEDYTEKAGNSVDDGNFRVEVGLWVNKEWKEKIGDRIDEGKVIGDKMVQGLDYVVKWGEIKVVVW